MLMFRLLGYHEEEEPRHCPQVGTVLQHIKFADLAYLGIFTPGINQ